MSPNFKQLHEQSQNFALLKKISQCRNYFPLIKWLYMCGSSSSVHCQQKKTFPLLKKEIQLCCSLPKKQTFLASVFATFAVQGWQNWFSFNRWVFFLVMWQPLWQICSSSLYWMPWIWVVSFRGVEEFSFPKLNNILSLRAASSSRIANIHFQISWNLPIPKKQRKQMRTAEMHTSGWDLQILKKNWDWIWIRTWKPAG